MATPTLTLNAGEFVALSQTAQAGDAYSALIGVGQSNGAPLYLSSELVGDDDSGTTPTMTATIQGSYDQTTWFTIVAHTAVATTAFAEEKVAGPRVFPPFLRVFYDTGGTAPVYSFTHFIGLA